jgi:hypothetical protein
VNLAFLRKRKAQWESEELYQKEGIIETSRVGVAAMPQTRIKEIFSSNLGQHTGYPA